MSISEKNIKSAPLDDKNIKSRTTAKTLSILRFTSFS